MTYELSRPDYATRYGPTAGDRVRLGDTDLLALIERDESPYGDEVLRGWGKTLRAGMMMQDRATPDSELDLLVINTMVIDPVLGVFKANIGIKDGVIVDRVEITMKDDNYASSYPLIGYFESDGFDAVILDYTIKKSDMAR